jgi:ribonuclease P protein component
VADDPSSFRDDERLRKAERLRERAEFLKTRRSGSRASSRHFVSYALPNDRPHARLGITASTKVGPATIRNWWKRRVREIFRRNKQEIRPGFDFVIIVKAGADQAPTDQLRDELIDLFERVAERADPVDDET